jgi:hypothetical protein
MYTRFKKKVSQEKNKTDECNWVQLFLCTCRERERERAMLEIITKHKMKRIPVIVRWFFFFFHFFARTTCLTSYSLYLSRRRVRINDKNSLPRIRV